MCSQKFGGRAPIPAGSTPALDEPEIQFVCAEMTSILLPQNIRAANEYLLGMLLLGVARDMIGLLMAIS